MVPAFSICRVVLWPPTGHSHSRNVVAAAVVVVSVVVGVVAIAALPSRQQPCWLKSLGMRTHAFTCVCLI